MERNEKLKDKVFFTKDVAGLLSISQSSVQQWTKKGWIPSPVEGTGRARQYDYMDCIKINLIKTLAKDGIRFEIIGEVMNKLKTGSPLTIEQSLKHKEASLIIRYYDSGKIGVNCVNEFTYGGRKWKISADGTITKESRDWFTFWNETTKPTDQDHIKTHIVNLNYIERKTLELLSK